MQMILTNDDMLGVALEITVALLFGVGCVNLCFVLRKIIDIRKNRREPKDKDGITSTEIGL